MKDLPPLSRREREIMDVVNAAQRATAAEITARIPDPPSYSAVRATLSVLVDKGHLRYEEDGPRYVYLATVPRTRARRTAVRQLLDTFFQGSPADAVVALLDETKDKLGPQDLERLSRLIEDARKSGR